ncbi:MAG: hypothetical protein LBI28_12740 [Treponema sp.]|jgi:hypothetical protein|nr:hypothetical protein [Treponema sp.]
MAKEIKAGVSLSLKDGFSQNMKKAAGAAGDFAGKTLGAIEKVDQAFSGLGTTLAAVGLTLSVGAAAKGVIEMDHRLTRLGISANASADEVSKLKQTIFDAAQAPDIKVDPSSILDGIDVIINKTNDLQFAQDNIRNVGLAIQATGESGESIGGIFSEFQKFQYTSEQISSLMDDLVAQSNEGAFSLAEFAKIAPDIFSRFDNAAGATPENILKANAALQIINAGAKSPRNTINAFNSAMEVLGHQGNQRNLQRLGIHVLDAEGKLRDFNDIMLDIAKKSENSRVANSVNNIFGPSSMLAIRSYISHGERMNETLSDLGDTTGLLQKQSGRMAGTLQSNIQNLQTAFSNAVNSGAGGMIQGLTNMLNKFSEDPARIKATFYAIAGGIGAIAAVKGIAGISRLVGSLMSLKGGGSINIGGALNMASAMPVYVTNMGGAGMGIGSGGQFQQPQLANSQLGKRAPLTSAQNVRNITPKQYAGAAGGMALTAAFVKIPQMVNELEEIKQNEELSAEERARAKGGAIGDATGSIAGAAVGGAAGIAAGAAVGAAVGSVVPVLGTAVGALVGAGIGALGMYLGGKAGRKIGEGIGAATVNDGSEEERDQQRRGNHRGHRSSSARRARQQTMPVSDLPPQITQTSPGITPQKVDVELGNAEIKLDVNLTDDRAKVSATVLNNRMAAIFNNTGSRVALRGSGV